MKVHIRLCLWPTFLPPNTSELDQSLSLNSDDTMFIIVT